MVLRKVQKIGDEQYGKSFQNTLKEAWGAVFLKAINYNVILKSLTIQIYMNWFKQIKVLISIINQFKNFKFKLYDLWGQENE
jgi:hypothetical protein